MRLRQAGYAIGTALLLIGWGGAAGADDVTNALVGVDPRNRLESGTGVAYGSVYGPQPSDAPEGEPDMAQDYSLRSSNDRFRTSDLNPLNLTGFGDLNVQSAAPVSSDDANIATLGRPDARRGVYYEDDLAH